MVRTGYVATTKLVSHNIYPNNYILITLFILQCVGNKKCLCSLLLLSSKL